MKSAGSCSRGRAPAVKETVSRAIAEGLSAGEILNGGLLAGMGVIGEKFKANKVYIPEVMIAARAMNAGLELLKPCSRKAAARCAAPSCSAPSRATGMTSARTSSK